MKKDYASKSQNAATNININKSVREIKQNYRVLSTLKYLPSSIYMAKY